MKKTIEAYALTCDGEILDYEGSVKTKKTIPLAISLSPRGFSKSYMKENGYEVKKVKITIIE